MAMSPRQWHGGPDAWDPRSIRRVDLSPTGFLVCLEQRVLVCLEQRLAARGRCVTDLAIQTQDDPSGEGWTVRVTGQARFPHNKSLALVSSFFVRYDALPGGVAMNLVHEVAAQWNRVLSEYILTEHMDERILVEAVVRLVGFAPEEVERAWLAEDSPTGSGCVLVEVALVGTDWQPVYELRIPEVDRVPRWNDGVPIYDRGESLSGGETFIDVNVRRRNARYGKGRR